MCFFFLSHPPTHRCKIYWQERKEDSKSCVLYFIQYITEEAHYFIVKSILIIPFLSYFLYHFSYIFLFASYNIDIQRQKQKQTQERLFFNVLVQWKRRRKIWFDLRYKQRSVHLVVRNTDPIKFDSRYEREGWQAKKMSLFPTHCKLYQKL